ncbi:MULTISPECIES: YflJ family protein [Bacillus cereus group]|nr:MULTISPECIES: YflJ family protein [Bacillus cereus group]MDA1674762.1 YflJ family protein [Bacillus cereus group sp. TH152-1LC]PGP12687.1 DUF2639 domain-containing protein [Bacillus cereus]
MAYFGSKGWYVQQLRALGITKHEDRKLESYRTHILANLYHTHMEEKKN